MVAHAEEREERDRDVGVYVLAGALAANTVFTVYNVATIGERKSDLYAFGEAMLTVPQTIAFGSLAAISDGDWKLTALAVWTAGLAVHGIVTLATDDEPETGRSVMFSIGERF
jgi:hypothetical protein